METPAGRGDISSLKTCRFFSPLICMLSEEQLLEFTTLFRQAEVFFGVIAVENATAVLGSVDK